MANGLILAFVVAVWAAYFVPLALRRYDEASKNSAVESSGPLSRVIARRSATVVDAVDPVDAVDEPVDAVPEPADTQVAAVVKTPTRTANRAARLAARRRRRTLLVLLATAAIVGALAGFSIIAPYWVAAPGTLVVVWLAACRIQVRAELGLSRFPHIPHIHLSASMLADDDEDTVVVSGQFADINPGRRHQMQDVPLEANALDDQIVIAVPSVSTTGAALWDPLPVTLPTYVTKPRAGRTVRTIEFGQAGAWTSGHIEGEDVDLPQRTTGVDDERRAVGH